MAITNDVFQAFVKCETKAYLILSGAVTTECELKDWQNRIVEEYKQRYFVICRANCDESPYQIGTAFPEDFDDQNTRFIFDCVVHADEIISYIDAVERVPPSGKKNS